MTENATLPEAECPQCGRMSTALRHCKYCDEFVPIRIALTAKGRKSKTVRKLVLKEKP